MILFTQNTCGVRAVAISGASVVVLSVLFIVQQAPTFMFHRTSFLQDDGAAPSKIFGHAPSPPFAVSGVVDARAFGRCYDDNRCWYTCDAGFHAVESSGLCNEACCPSHLEPGMCFTSTLCSANCPRGFEKVMEDGCTHLCCIPGGSPMYWQNHCFNECGNGFKSVLKYPPCWDLCIPNHFDTTLLEIMPTDGSASPLSSTSRTATDRPILWQNCRSLHCYREEVQG